MHQKTNQLLKDLSRSKVYIKLYNRTITGYLWLVVLLFFGSTLYLQGQNSDGLISRADSLFASGQVRASIPMYFKSFEQSKLDSNWSNVYNSIKGLCKVSRSLDTIELLINNQDSFLNSIPRDEYLNKGRINSYLGYSYNKHGLPHLAKPRYEDAILNKQMVLDTSNSNAVASIMRTYYNLSMAHTKLGDQGSAIKSIAQAISYAKAIDHRDLCKYIAVNGKFHFHNNEEDLAIAKYEETLNTCGAIDYVYQYLAEVYLSTNDLDKAEGYLKKSSDLINGFDLDQILFESDWLVAKGDISKALDLRSKIIDQNIRFPSERERIREYVRYAQLLYKAEKVDQSIELTREVLSHHFIIDDLDNFYNRPELNELLPDVWIIEALLIKANYFFDLYLNKSTSRDLDESRYYYDLVFSYFEKLKTQFHSDDSQFRIGSYTKNIYTKVIRFNALLYESTKDISYLKKVIALIQESNSFVLRNAISEKKAFEIYDVNQDSLKQYFELKNKLRSELDAESAHLLSFREYQKSIFENYPEIENYYTKNFMSLDSIQSRLYENELLLQFYSDEAYLICFAISNNDIYLKSYKNLDSLKSKVVDYNDFLTLRRNWDSQAFATTSAELFDELLNEILEENSFKSVNSLLILPDGFLKDFSFSALIPDIKQIEKYLINTYQIRYLNYIGQLAKQNGKSALNNGFVAFGIDYEHNGRDFPKLTYAVEEAKSSASILDGKSVLNRKVNFKNFTDELLEKNVVHISAHAFVDKSSFTESYIAFDQSIKSDPKKISYGDIINLNLNNDLIVLSACQTGQGIKLVGEGQMSLSRAFTYSGSQSVLGSYWDVSDQSSKEIMGLFYKNLKQGMTKSAALQLAQKEYLTNDMISSPSLRKPYYWSSWALYGSNDAIEINSSRNFLNSTLIYILVFILLVCLVAAFKYLR